MIYEFCSGDDSITIQICAAQNLALNLEDFSIIKICSSGQSLT